MKQFRGAQTEPWAFGLLAGLAVLLVAAMALGSGCLQPEWRSPPGVEPVSSIPGQRDRRLQAATAVRLHVVCVDRDTGHVSASGGSGVMVGESHVLTASHVVRCNGSPVVLMRTRDDRVYWMTVDRFDPWADVARLTTLPNVVLSDARLRPVVRPSIGPRPVPGEEICAEAANPEWVRSCGVVTALDGLPRVRRDSLCHELWESDVVHTGLTIHGNSGSGVYDAGGNLVGIVTELIPFETTGGRFTSLDAHRVLLP